MKNYSKFVVCLVVVSAVFFSVLPKVDACGPFSIDPLFSFTKHLDYPLTEFESDKIGIVPATYGRISLYVFYRQLNNLPLSAREKTEVARAITYRIGSHWSDGDGNGNKPSDTKPAGQNSPFAEWSAARAKVAVEAVKTDTEKQDENDYSFYTNCLGGAFETAADTLNARIAKYGTGDDVKDWVKAQDAVFSNCSKIGATPENANANAPEWLKKDRQYQTAAALFYQDKLSESRAIFEQIAADNNSTWKNTSKFVAARTYIRQASLLSDENDSSADANAKKTHETQRADLLKQAENRLENIAGDAAMKDFQDSARRLLNLVRYRGNPPQQRKFLAEKLVQTSENADIYNNLTDYIWLLDKVENDAHEKGSAIDQKQAEQNKTQYDYNYRLKLRDIDQTELGADLTDWLYSYQAADSFQHCYDKWKQTGSSAWFVASLTKVRNDAPQLGELLAAAEKVPAASPAYPTVRYHLIENLLENNKRAEAKQKLAEVLSANFQKFSLSTQNKFISQQMILAENMEDFLKYAERKPAAFVWSDDGNEGGDDPKNDPQTGIWANRVMFDTDAAAFFNEKMPLATLRQAAQSPNLPDYLKKFLVEAVWMRAFILKNQEVEREFAPLVAKYDKDLAASFSKLNDANDPNGREAALLLTVLNNPILQPDVPYGEGRGDSGSPSIDSIRGNWWCVAETNNDAQTGKDGHPAVYPDFLTAAQKTAAQKENEQLNALGASATYLAKRAFDFANKNMSNPDTPQILSQAVRATRYGCKDDETLKFSKADFDLLHKNFPNNEWTQKTPYYFGNN